MSNLGIPAIGADLLVTGVIAGALALGVSLFADRLGRWLRVLDVPDGRRKLHARATPQIGGFAVVPPVAAVALWSAAGSDYLPLFGGLVLAALAFLAIGYLDDRAHLRPMLRLALAAAVCFVSLQLIPSFGVAFLKFSFLSDALFLGGWTVLFSVLCLVGLQNALNMADGKNGLAPGLCLIWTLLIAAYAPPHLLPVIAALAIALAVVLAFNLAGRLFLGDSGCYAISIVVGLLAIHTHYLSFVQLPGDVVALWFLVPVIDCLRLMAGRILVGRSPFDPDRQHLHHHLDAVMPWRWGLLIYLGLVAGPGLLAYFRPGYTVLWAVLVLACYGTVLGLGMREARTRAIISVQLGR